MKNEEITRIFPETISPEMLNKGAVNMVKLLGIEFTEVGPDFLIAKMPVDERTMQPYGVLHGGASVVLAETLGSVASNCIVRPSGRYGVGLEINANHVRAANKGFVYGKVTPVHLGGRTHVWQILITDEQAMTVCASRITVAILDKK